ncbi:cytidine deaminase [bacterium]|nr:cytidine deaminase [bacterium]
MRRKTRSGRARIDEKILDGFLTKETSFLAAEEVKALVGTMRITVEELINQLLPWVAERAVAPLSRFKVGAICRGNSGNLYFGANIEFTGQSLKSTIHAEQAALANALSKNESGIRALAVTAPPCGHCRQFLNELNTADSLRIYLPGKEAVQLHDLLPVSFGPADLEIKNRLMDDQTHGLSLENIEQDELICRALDAANKSYAPYSKAFAGVAIQTENGQIFTGLYVENAAYNPSLLPLQAALANLIMAGRQFPEIQKVVLVQSKQPRLDHDISAQTLLKSISPVPLSVCDATE